MMHPRQFQGRVAFLCMLIVNLSMLGFYRTSFAAPPQVQTSSPLLQGARADADSADGGIEAPASELTEYLENLNVVMQTLFGVNAQLDRWNFFLHDEVTGAGEYEGTMDDIEELFSFHVAFAVAADEDVLEEELTPEQLLAWEAAEGRAMAVYGTLSTASGSIGVVGNTASVHQSGQPRVSRFYFADFWDGTEWWNVEPVLPGWWEIGCPPIPPGLCNCDQQCVDAACSVFIINVKLAIDTFNFTVDAAGVVYALGAAAAAAHWLVLMLACGGFVIFGPAVTIAIAACIANAAAWWAGELAFLTAAFAIAVELAQSILDAAIAAETALFNLAVANCCDPCSPGPGSRELAWIAQLPRLPFVLAMPGVGWGRN